MMVLLRRGGRRGLATASQGYRRVLVVVKHTPYEAYTQLKLQGKAPRALRWERLRNRHESHRACVDELCDLVKREIGEESELRVVSRDLLGPQHIEGVDMLIAVGGDGTVLSAAHYVDSISSKGVPPESGPVVLGVNSDPTKPHERLQADGTKRQRRDERRSFGALCYASANDMDEVVPRALRGEADGDIQFRHRMSVTVRGPLCETRLPPALNDVMVAHPSPAAVSRFRLEKRCSTTHEEDVSFNVWSSGIWVSTATGATAAMASAGGHPVSDKGSDSLQYMVRELLVGETDDADYIKSLAHGNVDRDHYLHLRWNSQHGNVWIDGQHTTFNLELGDEIQISARAPPLRIFSR